jgi:glucose/arabinose dehydrogenase
MMRLHVSVTWGARCQALTFFVVGLLVAVLFRGTHAGTAGAERHRFAFGLELVAEGFDQPVQVVDPDDGRNRLFVVEQSGRIRVLRKGRVESKPFLDLSALVSCCGERGLLSLAFHPGFAENGQFFVNYTDRSGDTMVARYQVATDDPDQADPASAVTVLTVAQPASNHNGGLLLFGPQDGYLYIGLGDGGGGNGQNGQDLQTLLGKLLRIDVDGTSGTQPYTIPPDNPFVGQPGARPEIWALGLRNPWRFSFDRATGDLWIGDVGSGTYEEVNYQAAASAGGENYGWNVMEGHACRTERGCEAFIPPVGGFDHDAGCVVTGGYVYRGTAMPRLKGVYLFADYCSGKVWGLVHKAKQGWRQRGPIATGLHVSSFGEGADGELYLVDLHGAVYRLDAP